MLLLLLLILIPFLILILLLILLFSAGFRGDLGYRRIDAPPNWHNLSASGTLTDHSQRDGAADVLR
jgi:hypothetical protein